MPVPLMKVKIAFIILRPSTKNRKKAEQLLKGKNILFLIKAKKIP